MTLAERGHEVSAIDFTYQDGLKLYFGLLPSQTLSRFGDTRADLLPVLVGFDPPGRLILNPSCYVWPALDALRTADGEATWGPAVLGGEALLAGARFGPLALPTDWVDGAGPATFAPSIGKPPRLGFDAVRVPLYLMLGDRGAKRARSHASGAAMPHVAHRFRHGSMSSPAMWRLTRFPQGAGPSRTGCSVDRRAGTRREIVSRAYWECSPRPDRCFGEKAAADRPHDAASSPATG